MCSGLNAASSALLTLPSSPSPAPQAPARPGSFSTATPWAPFPSLSPPQYLLHMFSLVLVDLPDGVELAGTRPDLFVQTGQTALLLGCQANQTQEQPFSYCSPARCIRGTTAPDLQQQPRLDRKPQHAQDQLHFLIREPCWYTEKEIHRNACCNACHLKKPT